jgi:hypothetical protein
VKTTARLLAFGLAGSAAVVVGGCGSSSAPSEPGGAALVAAAQKSVSKATSVHVDGVEPDNGLPVDLSINSAGDLSGTIRVDGASTEIIRVGGKTYLKLTSQILRQDRARAGACAVACGKWTRLSPTQATELVGPYTMTSLVGAVSAVSAVGLSSLGKVTDTGSAKISGRPVWVLREPDGSIVDVSQDSKHYPLEVRSSAGSSSVQQYSQWNSVPTPTAPPASQIVRRNRLR